MRGSGLVLGNGFWCVCVLLWWLAGLEWFPGFFVGGWL